MDAKPLDIISLNPEIIDEVEEYIKNECTSEEKDRLKKVEQAMAGFESPFGLELLSSVDWILRENGEKAMSTEVLKEQLRTWTSRKRDIFRLNHIKAAQNRLSKFQKELAY